MRVISLVPSITETLIECGVDVVGRTRFCIHPEQRVKDIPTVGGTKEANWDKCVALNADLVILDKEENTREMAAQCPLPWCALHITSVQSVGDELHRLATLLSSPQLADIAQQWRALAGRNQTFKGNWQSLPGIREYHELQPAKIEKLEYLIWRGPWMGIGQGTFIHSVLEFLGLGAYLQLHTDKYPTLTDDALNSKDTLYLFSSEPYPFARYWDDIKTMGINAAIVDGEAYSWYGIRSLRALQAGATST